MYCRSYCRTQLSRYVVEKDPREVVVAKVVVAKVVVAKVVESSRTRSCAPSGRQQQQQIIVSELWVSQCANRISDTG
jgi:hypothetical protein